MRPNLFAQIAILLAVLLPAGSAPAKQKPVWVDPPAKPSEAGTAKASDTKTSDSRTEDTKPSDRAARATEKRTGKAGESTTEPAKRPEPAEAVKATARTLLAFQAESPARGARSRGGSNLVLTVSFADAHPVIVSESSRVLRRSGTASAPFARSERGA